MKATIWAVTGHGNRSYCAQPIGGDFVIDTDNLPVFLGQTPIGKKSWYKHAPLEKMRFRENGVEDVCPLRGSMRGIATLYDNNRVHEYSYFMAAKAGIRFGKWSKRTGKRVFFMRSKKKITGFVHARMQDLIENNFGEGVLNGFLGMDVSEYWRSKDFSVTHKDRFGRVIQCYNDNNEISGVAFVNLIGLNEEQAWAVVQMAKECATSVSMEAA